MEWLEGAAGALAYRSWRVPAPVGALVVVPEYGEHSALYERFALQCNGQDLDVHAIDLAGHGLSDGKRGALHDVASAAEDVRLLIDRVRLDGPPLILLGHGFGGLLSIVLATDDPAPFSALVLTGTAAPPQPWIEAIEATPDDVEGGPTDPRVQSRDPWYLERAAGEPLAFAGGADKATLRTLIGAWRDIPGLASQIALPVLVLDGENDAVADVVSSTSWKLGIPDLRRCVVPGSTHAVLNDRAHHLVTEVVISFATAPHETSEPSARARLDPLARTFTVVTHDDATVERPRPPDIVLIMTDEQRFDWVGYASDGHFQTPTLDRLAASGICFDHAYSASTTCVPSRAALLTGTQARRTLGWSPNLPLREGAWTVARELRGAGYETALIGRMHFNPVHGDHGFDTMRMCENVNSGSGYDLDTFDDDYRRWLAEQGLPDLRVRRPVRNGRTRGIDTRVPRTFAGDVELHPTSWIARETVEFLENRSTDRPLFLIVSFPHPHSPYDPPQPYASMFDPDDTIMPEDGWDANDAIRGVFRERLDAPYVHSITSSDDRALLRGVLTAIRGVVKHIDDATAHILDSIDLSSTLLFFTTDHGDFGGHRGLFTKVPWIPFEDLVRVPFIVAGGPVITHRHSAALVQNASFTATCLDYAGVEVEADAFDFPSLRPIVEGAEPTDLTPIVADGAYLMIRRGPLKLIARANLGLVTPSAADLLLYDLDRDPGETHSVVDDPSYSAELAVLVERLRVEARRPTVG